MENRNLDFNDDLRDALECLKRGGVILYPTDTVWGIGCDATNPEAVKKIYNIKKRSDSKSMLVLVNNELGIERIVDEVPEVAWQLLEAAVDPLTVIYDGTHGVAPELIAPDGSLGIRITKERFSNELCRRLGRPLVSTSANISGQKAPAFFKEISSDIINAMDYVVKYRRDDNSPKTPSNIIKLGKDATIKIIR